MYEASWGSWKKKDSSRSGKIHLIKKPVTFTIWSDLLPTWHRVCDRGNCGRQFVCKGECKNLKKKAQKKWCYCPLCYRMNKFHGITKCETRENYPGWPRWRLVQNRGRPSLNWYLLKGAQAPWKRRLMWLERKIYTKSVASESVGCNFYATENVKMK